MKLAEQRSGVEMMLVQPLYQLGDFGVGIRLVEVLFQQRGVGNRLLQRRHQRRRGFGLVGGHKQVRLRQPVRAVDHVPRVVRVVVGQSVLVGRVRERGDFVEQNHGRVILV